jgi:thioredoxin reductase (NADPH)
MEISSPVHRYDALIVGAGPAGLSAAIYLARACRSVVVFQCERPGRSDWGQRNHNVLGFPDGISIVDLCQRGRHQAEHFGAEFHDQEVSSVKADSGGFTLAAGDGTHHGRGIIFATGVTDRWVEFPNYQEFIGRTMHWCITCDGYEMRNQRVVVVGNDEDAAEMAIQMLIFQPQHLVLVTNDGALGMRQETATRLHDMGIRLMVDRIRGARAKAHGEFEALILEQGDDVELDHLFSAQGAEPNTSLARSLDVDMTGLGHIKVDTEARTSMPGVYAAGDVTRLFSHQVVTATHEGASAAMALNYDLFQRDREAAAARNRA